MEVIEYISNKKDFKNVKVYLFMNNTAASMRFTYSGMLVAVFYCVLGSVTSACVPG